MKGKYIVLRKAENNWDIGRLCFARFAVNNGFNSRGYEVWMKDIKIWEENNNSDKGNGNTLLLSSHSYRKKSKVHSI